MTIEEPACARNYFLSDRNAMTGGIGHGEILFYGSFSGQWRLWLNPKDYLDHILVVCANQRSAVFRRPLGVEPQEKPSERSNENVCPDS
jgi:hypothetical protein